MLCGEERIQCEVRKEEYVMVDNKRMKFVMQ